MLPGRGVGVDPTACLGAWRRRLRQGGASPRQQGLCRGLPRRAGAQLQSNPQRAFMKTPAGHYRILAWAVTHTLQADVGHRERHYRDAIPALRLSQPPPEPMFLHAV